MPDTATATPSTANEVFDAIDALEGDVPDPSAPEPRPVAAAPTPEPTPEPAKPAAVTQTAAPKVDELFAGDMPAPKPPKPVVAAQEPVKPATNGKTDEFKTPKELRTAYETTKAERDKLQSEIAEARKQVDAAKKAGATEAEGLFRSELETLKKERDELDTKVRYTDYTKSGEYQTKYVDPLKKVWVEVLKELEGVKLPTEDGSELIATQEHMLALMRMPTIQAAKQSREWFGDASSEMMGYRRRLLDLATARDAAVEEWRTKGSEMTAKQQREAQERGRTLVGRFDSEVQGMREAASDLFMADPKDADETGYFTKGNNIVNIAFRGEGLADGMTQEQRTDAVVRAQANVAAKASAFGVVVHRLNRVRAENEELRTKLKEFEKTEPGVGDSGRGGQPAVTKAKTPEDEIDAMSFEP